MVRDRNGVCRDSGNGLGLDNRHGFHSVHSHGDGGALFGDAYQVDIHPSMIQDKLLMTPVGDYTTPLQYWHPQGTDPLQPGSPAGRTGSDRSRQRHRWITLWQR